VFFFFFEANDHELQSKKTKSECHLASEASRPS